MGHQNETSSDYVHVQPTHAKSNQASTRRRKGKNIQDYESIAPMNTHADIAIGKLYSSKKELQRHLGMVAMSKNFEFKVKRSTMERFEAKCVDNNCPWRIRATKLKSSDFFEVRKFNEEHKCSLDVLHRDHRQASSSLIGHTIKSKYEGVARIYRPKDIIDDMRVHFGVNISYGKAWRARESALDMVRGSPEESFALLPFYCAMLETKNPSTVTHIETDANNHFLYFFMAMGPSIRGFHSSMRPVIAIDRTFLKGKYGGTLFVAACQDGEDQIYPLAFGVGDSENDASWSWFLTKLRGAIGNVENIVFVSDRHGSIATALQIVFPEAHHGACMYHIQNNLRSKYGTDEEVFKLYIAATKKYRMSEFDQTMANIRAYKPEVVTYLQEIGYSKWARAHFTGNRYNMMTTNIAESMNAKLLDARDLPITALAEHLRGVLQEWFHQRRNAASALQSTLTACAEDKVRKNYMKALSMQVSSINLYALQVHDPALDCVVDLNEKTCTCREFDLDQLPCAHATAACRHRSLSVYSLCSQLYTSNALVLAYAEPIWPVGNRSEWNVSEDVRSRIVLPPIRQIVPGRRRKRRLPSQGEEMSTKKCGRCKETGHNRRNCKNPVALH